MNNPYAVGSRVYLRAPTIEDAQGAWHEWFSDPEITKYLVDRYLPNSKEAQVAFFESLNLSKDRVVLSVCRLDNDEHIGVCGLSAINWFHGYADYSYVIGVEQSDNSLVVLEMVKLLLDIAFTRLNLTNLRSVHVGSNPVTPQIDKLFGFKTVGVLKDYVICEATRQDLVISQLAKEEWQARNSSE